MNFSWERLSEILTLIYESDIAQIIIGGLIILALMLFLKRIIRSVFSRGKLMDRQESDTIESLINSIIKYVAGIGFIFYALTVLGLEVGSALAGAGVLGIIIGFGAQSLIQDLLAGLFIVYEKQLKKGDWILINNLHSGTVEGIGFRILKLRKWTGELLTINNGQVQTIENYNDGEMQLVETITTSFYQNPAEVIQVLEEVCVVLNQKLGNELKKDLNGEPIQPYKFIGTGSLNDNYRGYSYQIIGLCNDKTYFQTARDARSIIAQHLYDHNIRMPEQPILIKEQQND
ncbi:mechanosensitive ion channel family protein [Amphibacillus sp. Q70]|uniref:mechanosensitive ion channel family protein n=1 Tax=Amphibacillus sp. Q70 TaxID=3453416 RepID=UPI003F8749BC